MGKKKSREPFRGAGVPVGLWPAAITGIAGLWESLMGLTTKRRTRRANRQLGGLLACVAGAVDAGGLLAVGRYTPHLTGIGASVPDNGVL